VLDEAAQPGAHLVGDDLAGRGYSRCLQAHDSRHRGPYLCAGLRVVGGDLVHGAGDAGKASGGEVLLFGSDITADFGVPEALRSSAANATVRCCSRSESVATRLLHQSGGSGYRLMQTAGPRTARAVP
jgi:hypothetical protein